MNIPIEIYADLQYPAPPDRHHAMQGDKGFREIRLYPTAGGLPWEPPAGYRLEVRYTKTDGTGGAYDTLPDGSSALMSAQDGCYTVGTVPQMFTAPGLVRVSVVFISGEDEIATFPAYVEVTRCPGVDARSENYENLSPYVRKSGWSGGKLLGTDENGTVVEVTSSPAAEGHAIVSAKVIRADLTTTFRLTLDDGSIREDVLTFDANGVPVRIVADGREIPVEWEDAT